MKWWGLPKAWKNDGGIYKEKDLAGKGGRGSDTHSQGPDNSMSEPARVSEQRLPAVLWDTGKKGHSEGATVPETCPKVWFKYILLNHKCF